MDLKTWVRNTIYKSRLIMVGVWYLIFYPSLENSKTHITFHNRFVTGVQNLANDWVQLGSDHILLDVVSYWIFSQRTNCWVSPGCHWLNYLHYLWQFWTFFLFLPQKWTKIWPHSYHIEFEHRIFEIAKQMSWEQWHIHGQL